MVAKYKWPTDPPGKPASHSISWSQHQHNSGTQGTVGPTTGSLGTSGNAAAQQAIYQTTTGDFPGAPPGPQPPDWQQQAYQQANARNVQYADAQATFDRGNIQRDFGYTAQGGVDPNNPYSRAALNERNYANSQRGDTNSYAAQGQLYSGALQNQKNATTFGYLSSSNSLKNQYNTALGQTSLNQLGAYASAGSAVSQDKINALLKALGQ